MHSIQPSCSMGVTGPRAVMVTASMAVMLFLFKLCMLLQDGGGYIGPALLAGLVVEGLCLLSACA
jgi:hypothetical protein